MVNEQS
jgi:uracil-DNA glycosylase